MALNGPRRNLRLAGWWIAGVCSSALANAWLPLPAENPFRSTLAMLPFVLRGGIVRHLRNAYCWPMVLRNIGEVCGSLLYVSSLVRLPIANTTAIMQTSPLAITAAAALFLGDRVGWRRWMATSFGLIGALIVIRPGGADFSWWYLPAVIAVAFVTLRDLSTRYIPHSTPTMFITFLTFMVTLAGGLAMGLVLGFGAMLALQGERETPVGVRSTAPALAEGPLLRVNFTAAASETQLRFALIEARATIVAGPTRLGDYYLKPAPGQLAAARDSLSRSKVVQRIDEVPGLPPELTE